MKKLRTLERIEQCGAMAIVRVETVARGIEIAKACLAGGIDVLEISYTHANASQVIQALTEQFGDRLCVGAGTVLDAQTARLAILSGASFVIAPNFSAEVSRMCNRYMIPYAPGCTTVSEMIEALEHGASIIKAFPIANFYGPQLGQILRTPIPDLPLLASGGITLDNIDEWLSNGVMCLGFGGLLSKGDAAVITEHAKTIRMRIDQFRTQSNS